MTIRELAALILEQRRERIASRYGRLLAEAERVSVVPGRRYTTISRGPEGDMSAFLMVDSQTGAISGIRGGAACEERRYGSLATASQWYWGGYVPRKIK